MEFYFDKPTFVLCNYLIHFGFMILFKTNWQ